MYAEDVPSPSDCRRAAYRGMWRRFRINHDDRVVDDINGSGHHNEASTPYDDNSGTRRVSRDD
jgi:hypothetical protein